MPKPIINLSTPSGLVPVVDLKPGVLRVNQIDEERAEVFIYGDIGGYWEDSVNADTFSKELSLIDVPYIDARVNSGGGYIFEGITIYNALARHLAHVTMHIEGIAASIASVITMAGDKILIYEGSRDMIHKPSSFAGGSADDLRKEAEVLDALESDIIDLYQARTGKSRAKLTEWIAAETWFSARDAVKNGFADEMVPAKKKNVLAKSAMMNFYQNAPQDIIDQENSIPEIREFEYLLREGEGIPGSLAKRIARIASKTISQSHREGGLQLSDFDRLDAAESDKDAKQLLEILEKNNEFLRR